MAGPSVRLRGLPGLAALSLAGVVVVALTAAAAGTGEFERQGAPRGAAQARDANGPAFDARQHIPAHGSWESLFRAWGA